MDDATILAKLDQEWRTVIQIRGRIRIYDGCQDRLTTALRRMALEGRIEVDHMPTKAPCDRRQSKGPPVLLIERYRLPEHS
jgi:hypothetical protein